jgi:hypothetical protein
MNEDGQVVFEEDEERQRSSISYPETPKIVQWIMAHSMGLITNERTANYVLIGFAIMASIVSLYLFFGGDNNLPPKPPAAVLQQMPVNK